MGEGSEGPRPGSVSPIGQWSIFKTNVRPNGQVEHLFNGPGDGSNHGHVVENPLGGYDYVRDPEGSVYIDRLKGIGNYSTPYYLSPPKPGASGNGSSGG